MDFGNSKESKNFEDHTGRGEIGKFLDFLFTSLNPVYAYRNIKGATRQGIDLRGAPISNNFKDRTGIPKTKEMQDRVLFELIKNHQRPGDLLLKEDLRPMMVDPILNYAHDPFKRVKKQK